MPGAEKANTRSTKKKHSQKRILDLKPFREYHRTLEANT